MFDRNNLNIQEEHKRVANCNFTSKEIEKFLIEMVAKKAGINASHKSVTTKVRFEDETEGSPAYKVGVKAFVTLEQDMRPQTEEG